MVHHPHDEIKDEVGRMKDEKKRGKIHPSSLILQPSEFGSVSVEMVFFLLVFVVAFFGAVEMAREISVKHALDVGTYRAARYLSIVPSDQMTARNMIQTELDRNVLGGAGSVQMTVDMPSQAFQTVFSVTAEVPYQPVIPLMMFAPQTLRVVHSQSIEAYP
jgi:Flp pilus assembly protein TadG